jgi:uncharacterized protein YqfB (UPF0267 family)
MPAYNFQSGFRPKILSGEKITTIRHCRRRRTRPGELLALYVGMRTKFCRVIARTTVVSVIPIELDLVNRRVFLAGHRVPQDEVETLAREDGFASADSMFDWFEAKYRGPHDATSFCGERIAWAFPFRLPESEAAK